MRPCFAFAAAKAAGQPETLSIYDEIGFWGVQAGDFRAALASVKSDQLNVEINSPGGDMFAGMAIYNMLRASGKKINVTVMGVAASSASLIAMAGDEIRMPKNTAMMIHKPWAVVAGNDDELRETADTLTKFNASVKQTYLSRTGIDEKELDEMLTTDTWLSADEALEKGFATEVVDEIKVNAKFDLARAELPEHIKAALKLVQASQEEGDEAARQQAEAEAEAAAAAEEERRAREEAERIAANPVASQINEMAVQADLAEFAPLMAVSCATIDAAKTRISVAREIKALCTLTKLPDMAAELIKGEKSVADARAAISAKLAEQDDKTTVDTTRKLSKTTASASANLNPSSLWAKHNTHKDKAQQAKSQKGR